jgi:teichuronic acid biosynthesis glycosyltransferase TuaH
VAAEPPVATRAGLAGRPHLVWLAGVSWEGIPGTDRHMATAMARYADILWVDPPVSPARRSLRDNLTGRSLRPKLAVINESITRLTPTALPGISRPVIRTMIPFLVRLQAKWALRRLNVRPAAVVATHLEGSLRRWGAGVTSVLYGTDDYVAGAELMGLSARRQVRQERRSLVRAQVVAAVSGGLADRWARLGARPELIPNGCWPAPRSSRSVPPETRDLPRPVVGLVGQLSDRIDISVLEVIASAGYSLLIVGPLDPRWGGARFNALTSMPHVCYAGSVPGSAVPDYLAAMDVGITPYRDTPFNRASFPLKTLEYLGAGVPAVSAALPAARWLQADLARTVGGSSAGKVMELAVSASDFADAVGRVLDRQTHPDPLPPGPADGSSATGADMCVAFAARHSWQSRASALAALIGLD